MKTKPITYITVVTLGCAKNLVDSEFLTGRLKASGLKVFHEFKSGLTEAVVINTCGFINDAKEESVDTILEYLKRKEQNEIRQVFVMGCLTQRYREEISKELPQLDGVFGVNEQDKVIESITGRLRNELAGERMLTTPAHYAYLKISEGCDRSCSFCAIPEIRGRNISRSIEELKSEAESLASRGVKELILIAQDLTYYGIDLYGKRMLAELLRELDKVVGVRWIRLHYTYPAGFPLEVLDVMRHSSKICNYLDIPLQHIDDDLLRSMRRGIDGEKTEALINTIRETLPNIAIRTTLIAGYPGETDNQFRKLMEFAARMKFERLGVFPYSHEEGTPAHVLEDNIPDEMKQERVDQIMEQQQEISLQNNRDRIGQNLWVVIDREDEDYYAGRTEFDSPEVDNEILLDKTISLKPGDFVEVNVTEADYFDLYGKVIRKEKA
ncbi:MAG: 30S ribosomal protein S12 methylthiotransferase RimO [Bacteroidota bacterium]